MKLGAKRKGWRTHPEELITVRSRRRTTGHGRTRPLTKEERKRKAAKRKRQIQALKTEWLRLRR
jgi:hypothetical protein